MPSQIDRLESEQYKQLELGAGLAPDRLSEIYSTSPCHVSVPSVAKVSRFSNLFTSLSTFNFGKVLRFLESEFVEFPHILRVRVFFSFIDGFEIVSTVLKGSRSYFCP